MLTMCGWQLCCYFEVSMDRGEHEVLESTAASFHLHFKLHIHFHSVLFTSPPDPLP